MQQLLLEYIFLITYYKFNSVIKLKSVRPKSKNALETIALKKYPKLKKIKLFLESIDNPLFVRMTGSGSTIVAYYNSLKSCKLAKAKFKRKYKNYWCVTAKTI